MLKQFIYNLKQNKNFIQFVLSLALFLSGNAPFALGLIGCEIFTKGVKSILNLKFEETLLMTIAAISALFIGESQEAFILIFLFRLGELIEKIAVKESKMQLERLTDIRPIMAWIVSDNGEKQVQAKNISPGSIISIHSYERIPIDGEVIEGTSFLDTSSVTGESFPVAVKPGTKVKSGMINGSKMLKVRTMTSFQDSTASKIVNMIENAITKKGNAESSINQFAKIYTPVIMLLSVLVIILPTLTGFGDFSVWLTRGLAFLVAACPCAVVISVPLAFYSGIGASAKMGAIVKGGKYIELLSKIKAIVFDKTGTLTKGTLRIKKVYSFSNDISENQILLLTASAERYSHHLIASAIINSVNIDNKNLNIVQDLTEIPGMGIKGIYMGKELTCGRKELLKKNEDLKKIENLNMSVILSLNGKLIGAIELTDEIRTESQITISRLLDLGVKNIYMLTGDKKKAAKEIALEAGINNYEYNLLPEDKLRILEQIKNKHGFTAFIGDGINDAPVLLNSDCGIAMGLGTDLAIASSDIVLAWNNIETIPKIIRLFRRVMKIINLNIGFAIGSKILVLLLAIMGLAPIWLAVLADVGVTLLTSINSMLILYSVE